MANNFKGVYLIDGFPRNQENIDAWNSHIGDKVELSFLLLLECSRECMMKRLAGRGRKDDNPE